MPRFSYKAIDGTGRQVTGEAESSDRKRLLQQLSQKGLRPVSVESLGEKVSTDESIETSDFFKNSGKRSRFLTVKRSKSSISLEFLKRLLVLLSSGMSLGDAVSLLSRRLSDPQMKDLCEAIWKRLSEGQTLASSMRAHTNVFALSTIHLVEAGEASGNLIAVLERIVAYLEESRDVRKKLVSNLTYPAFVLSTAVGVVIILLTFLLPKIQDMLDQLGGDLPLITQILIGGSEATITFGPFVLATIIALVIGLRQWRRTASGARRTDYWLLRTPIIGRIYLYSNIYGTTNLMSTLLGSGVNTTETLRLVERTIANVILRGKFSLARKQIQEGVSMATAIQRVHYMPDLAMDILTVGENTGNIVNSLNDINKVYREELTKSLNILTTATVAVALGGAILLVAIIAISVVFSVLSVGQSLQL
ncbi:type II secretion system F family protein [Puniceicoccales bacterium CK1056]|uniref:Type II secretion system F family protein n=1 Tax=Oceanipulchritudo coccoides TaxID=2706888 RepID=A0A6B2M0R0_9BACT|nr:type II secretion system F family protein [Oceanipulchritudo coccoides]NDV62498.1 type II secretion system F family protein [Oceanipulchritudo coccoides]